MEMVAKLSLMLWFCVLLMVVNEAFSKFVPVPGDKAEQTAGVSIEDFIDLDGPPSPPSSFSSSDPDEGALLTSHTGSDVEVETTVGHGSRRIAPGLGPAPPPILVLRSDVIKPAIRHAPMTSDDEDVELSGDGSGSGDGAAEVVTVSETVTPNVTMITTTSRSADQGSKVNMTLGTPQNLVIGEGGETVTEKVDHKMTPPEESVTVSDVIYTADVWPPVPVKEQTDEGDEIELWSPWIRTSDVTEVRIRTCTGSVESCNGTEAEMRHCDRENNRCDVKEVTVTSEEKTTEEIIQCPENTVEKEEPEQDQPPVQKPRPLPPGEIDLQRTELEPCTYSLFDVKRGKYLVTQWSLTRLVTQAKVKKWCAKPQEYLVFHSPHSHCRRYYRDLCHVSMRCKGSRTPPKARGDFAEGCWRQFVYGGQLPVGLSNRQTIVYLICQRFAAMSTLGKTFGHKKAHFATLYDTKGRAPVVSLVRLTQIGDLAWPHTPYFIEHGLVEDTEDTAWFLRKAKKGMVRLEDMGKCQDEDSCQLGAHQVLPSDYSATTYRTAHLIWPELAGPDPLSRTATFTMTNTAPMHAALYPAWHRAVLHVRKFALQQCGVPVVSPDEFMSSQYHHSRKHQFYHYFGSGGRYDEGPAVYVASGIIPSRDPMETIGNDINVPFMFWMAACCVVRNSSASHHHHHHHHHHQNDYANLFHNGPQVVGKHHSSFAVYARNAGPGSVERNGDTDEVWGQVVAAPVLQLELLLQDIYKTLPTDPDVNLFPAAHGACSELRNDFSRHVHL